MTATAIDAAPRLSMDETLVRLAERFRSQVTGELARLDDTAREPLRGDYLFVVDGAPRFVVVVQKSHVRSGLFEETGDADGPKGLVARLKVNDLATTDSSDSLAPDVSREHEERVTVADVYASARACVQTDATTLSRLLSGTMKAKAAFLAGKVRIDGDLPGFLRLIGLLKERGVRAPGET